MDNESNKNLNNLVEKAPEITVSSLFKGDSVFVFIFKKTQKILTALYLITNLLPDEEPIKWHLRKKGGNILSDIIVFYESKKEGDLHKVKSEITEVLSMLEIGEFSGLIGPMNAKIIKAEFTIVYDTLSSDIQSRFVIPSNFFNIGQMPKEKDIPEKGYEATPHTDKEHHIGQIMSVSSKGDIGHSPIENKSQKDINVKDRKEQILEVIKQKKEVSIRDIKDIISDCSEKTIQRELLAFVANGVLKKVGERRWSRYQII